VSGVVSAGLRIAAFPHASAGASFHAAIRSGKFQGTICAANAAGRDGTAREPVHELVRPPRVVEEVRGRERDVDVARFLDRLAAVERLDDRQLARPLLDEARDAEHVLAALERRERRPLRLGGAGRRHGPLDVGGRRLRDLGQRLLRRRVDRRRVAALGRVRRLAVDRNSRSGRAADVGRRLGRR
jgi:hypothetical protein